jgi:hypothetical protein
MEELLPVPWSMERCFAGCCCPFARVCELMLPQQSKLVTRGDSLSDLIACLLVGSGRKCEVLSDCEPSGQ